MDLNQLRHLLTQVQKGNLEIDTALQELRQLPYSDLGFAKIDNHRSLRTGFPEVIFCQGKTNDQVREIFQLMLQRNSRILATRMSEAMYLAIKDDFPQATYHQLARCLTFGADPEPTQPGLVLVVSAGTSDLPVAEEAVVTARYMGSPVETLYDVGVAGLHRILSQHQLLQKASVVIVVAGMEGALASVVAGLVQVPIVAVPTSVGYGANFGGLAPLLAMLNSCATGVGVVNIDNGFGAATLAHRINQSKGAC